MLTFSLITLFPDWITQYTGTSIIGRAQTGGYVRIEAINPRAFTADSYNRVDDTPYGGGSGMVMQLDPIMQAYKTLLPLSDPAAVILPSPSGKPFRQADARRLSMMKHIVFICGHYEGIDARLTQLIPEIEPFSLGDFVLTGGELPALCMLDAVTRLLPGVLGNQDSLAEESFENGLLEYPHYTRPPVYEWLAVPDILLSGNHQAIARWRHEMAFKTTARQRPDLLEDRALSAEEKTWLAELSQEAAACPRP
jgi:tRNA (guanine37-N1)-methyltransferase